MDSFGIIPLRIVPVRSQPTHKAEMVTQLMFGEIFKITDKILRWYKVRGWWDDYEGWLEEQYFIFISEDQYQTLTEEPVVILERKDQATWGDPVSETVYLLEGSRLPSWDLSHHTCQIGSVRYSLPDIHPEAGVQKNRAYLTGYAQFFKGVPYLWGGTSSCGFDCSGYVQTVFRICGIRLPRDASRQCRQGKDIPFIDKARPGDLAFFGEEKDLITHVGIILSGQRIIHASGRVRIDRLDHQGIFDTRRKTYTHKLRLIKNPFNE